MSEQDCLRGTGLSPADLADPDRTIEASQELSVTRNLLARLGDQPGLGTRAGLIYTVGRVGILGFALLSSPTLRDAITIGLRYFTLSSAFVSPAVEESGERARLVLDDSDIPPDVRPFLVERDLTALGQLLPVVMGGENPWADTEIEVRLDPDRCHQLSEALGGVRVIPDRLRNLITFPRDLLDRALPQADTQTAALCEQQCHVLLDHRLQRRGTAAMVRSLLLRDPSNMPSMDAAARQLRIDTRTLHRHLEQEGTSYRALTTETREAIAVELLGATGLSVAEVAHHLGYSEVAAFSRAFKRWTGAPPSTYRRRA